MSKLKKYCKQPSMNDDIQKYPIFKLIYGELEPIDYIKTTDDYNHYELNCHHFIECKLRKKDPEFYKRVEYLQKLIIMPAKLNLEISSIDEKRFFNEWGIDKAQVLFNRKLWRSNYYS